MMILFLGYVALCLWGLGLNRSKGELEDYLSLERTQCVKGVFIMLVFFSHFNSYVTYDKAWDLAYQAVVRSFGQGMVTLFLFYSGYAVMVSAVRKGMGYVKSMPWKRIGGTLFQFDCAVVGYMLLGPEGSLTWKKGVLSLIGWESVGNSNWYIFVILVLYALSYLAFRVLGTERKVPVAWMVLVLTAGLVVGCHRYGWRPSWWYDTALCYPMGMLWAAYREKIDKVVQDHGWLYLLVLVLGVTGVYVLKFRLSGSMAHTIVTHLVFTGTVVLATMKLKVGNPALQWLGKYLFEIYILQRIPMILGKRWGFAEKNIYLYVLFCLVVTLVLSPLFRRGVSWLWGLVNRGTGSLFLRGNRSSFEKER